MRKTQIIVSILSILFFQTLNAQEYLGINFPSTLNEQNQKCNYLSNIFKQKPKEVNFSIRKEGNKLFFSSTQDNRLVLLSNITF
mgnify:CR=1 FL=1